MFQSAQLFLPSVLVGFQLKNAAALLAKGKTKERPPGKHCLKLNAQWEG